MGWPIAPNKVVAPCQDIVFLGVRIDILNRQLSLPDDKLAALLSLLQAFADRESATKREIESLIGKLNFAATVVHGGRTFLRRMIDLIAPVEDHDAVVSLSTDFKADVQWWHDFAADWNGKEMMVDDTPIGQSRFVTDASGYGVCAVFDGRFFIREHCPVTRTWHINETECLAAFLAAVQWCQLWRDQHILVESDNMVTVWAINKGTSRSPIIMAMLRQLFWLSAKFNFRITARHVKGLDNRLADAGSRGDIHAMLATDSELRFIPSPAFNPNVFDRR
jgi:hypothetical protein